MGQLEQAIAAAVLVAVAFCAAVYRWLERWDMRRRLETIRPERFGVGREELVELAEMSVEAFRKRVTPGMLELLEKQERYVDGLYFRARTRAVVGGLRLRVLEGQYDLFRPIVETVARETVWAGKPRRDYDDALHRGAVASVRAQLGLAALEEPPGDEPDPEIVERDQARLKAHVEDLKATGFAMNDQTHEGEGPDIISRMMAKAAEDHRKKLEAEGENGS